MRSSFAETIKGALALGISSSLVTAVGFLLIPLYTRYLSVEEFGLLGLINLAVSVAVAIFGMGLNTAIFRSYFDYEDNSNKRKLVGTALIVASLASVSLVALATVASEPIIATAIFTLPETGRYFQLALYTGAITLVSAVPLAVYRANRQFGRFAIINISAAILQIVLIVLLVAVAHMETMGILIGQFTATLAINLLLLYTIRHEMELALLRGEVRKLLTYGIPLVPGSVFYLILTSGSLFFVQRTEGLAEVGTFNLATRIASVFAILIITPFQLIWPPMMFSVEKKEYSLRFYANMLVYALYVSVGLGMFLSVYAPEIIDLVASEAYASAAQLVWLLIFGHILFVAQNTLNVGIILRRKTIFWSAVLVIEALICILLWTQFAPQWGAQGIAVGSIIGYIVGVILTLLFSRRFITVNYEWKRVLYLIVLLPVTVAISNLIPSSFGVFAVITLKALLILSLLCSPFLIKFWHEDELSAARQFTQILRARLPLRLQPADRK
jgi:O-antigen/teichoic acid export membrane protein